MATPSFGDVARFVELASQIYTYGFSKSHRAPSLYNEFGDNIKHLGTNLGDLQKVLQGINEHGVHQPADLAHHDSLCDIIGSYQTTLQECDKLLKDKAKFSWRGDFIHNIIWNFAIASDVQDLKDRVAFLNIKLLTVLKTVDLRLAHQLNINIFRIHRDLATRIDGARDDIIQQFQILRSDIWRVLAGPSGIAALNSPTHPGIFDIPISLETLFEQQIQTESIEDGSLPLVQGLDAAVYHINAANTIPVDSRESKKERQWLAVAKGFWIISKVKAGQEYMAACSFRPSDNFERQMNDMGITIASYVKGLEIELLENAKSSTIRTFTPETGVILDIFRDNPELWFEQKVNSIPTPSWELEFSEKIMNVSLKGPYPEFDQTLNLFRLTEVDLKLVISDIPRNSVGTRERNNNNINVDLRRARYVPLYASSTSSSTAFNVKFQGDKLAPGSTAALSFKKRSDLFKFQHALTGYQVVFEALDIQVTTYVSSRLLGGAKETYSGRLQLWRAKRPANSTVDGSSSSPGSSTSPNSAATSPVTANNGSSLNRPWSPAGVSDTSSSDHRASNFMASSRFSLNRRGSTLTTASAFSTGQSLLKSSASTFQTSVVDSEGNIGIVLDKPENSMLVLCLEQNKKSSLFKDLSFLAVQLDEMAYIEPSACDCRKADNTCRRSVIQHSGSNTLHSHRYDAGTDLDAWNLAALGKWQRKSLPDSKERIVWVAVDFGSVEDRVRFNSMFSQLKTLLLKQKSTYHADLKNLRS